MMISLDFAGGALPAYRAEPKGELKGALIVIHEIWGLVDHIKGIADRYAAEGYLVIAPDLLGGIGIVPEVGLELQALMFSTDEEERAAAQPRLRETLAPMRSPEYGTWAVGALTAAVDYLDAQPGVLGRIGVVGFCFGGSYSFAIAAADPRIRAAVPYYGQPPESAKISAIACPILAFYGETDAGLMATLPDVSSNMAAARIDFEPHVYEGAGHAFFNDTNSLMYRAEIARDSWERAVAFLNESLASK